MKRQRYSDAKIEFLASPERGWTDPSNSTISSFSSTTAVCKLQTFYEAAGFVDENQAFASAAQKIREDEKARLARELHDEFAQSLTVLKMDAVWVRNHISAGSELIAVKLDDMVELLDRTIAATRRMAADLRPLMLDDLGLVAAIEWLASGFMKRCGVPYRLEIGGEFELELVEPHATALFRIIQESLNNIAKHANASEVVISMNKIASGINLVVKDDGCGFYSADVFKPQALGIVGMCERAQLLGGHVMVKSALGMGTSVEVSIPFGQIGAH